MFRVALRQTAEEAKIVFFSLQTVGFLPGTGRGQGAAAAPPLLVLQEAIGLLAGADVDLAVVWGGGGDGDDGVEEGRGGGGGGCPGLLLDDGDDPVGGPHRPVLAVVQQDGGDEAGLRSPGAVTAGAGQVLGVKPAGK